MTAAAWLWLGVAALCIPLRRRASRRSRDDTDLPLTLDLAAAALRAGQSVPAALLVAAPAAGRAVSDALRQVAGLLRLGADPDEAWRCLDSSAQLAALARTARRSSASGARLAGAFEQLAGQLRRDARAAAEARAQRAGVLAVAPLAFCFLPSFVCLGIVPAVVGLAGAALHGSP